LRVYSNFISVLVPPSPILGLLYVTLLLRELPVCARYDDEFIYDYIISWFYDRQRQRVCSWPTVAAATVDRPRFSLTPLMRYLRLWK